MIFDIGIIMRLKKNRNKKTLLAFPYLLKSRTYIFKAVPLPMSIRKDKS